MARASRVLVTVIIPNKDTAVTPYHIVEDEEGSDCVTLGSNNLDIKEIIKVEVKSALKEQAELRQKEADYIDRLAEEVPEMRDSEVIVVSEKIQRMELPKCVYDMYGRIGNPRNFRAALAAGE